MQKKSKLLIADSNEINRTNLKNLFEDDYIIVEAKNEEDLTRTLMKYIDVSAIIIDISLYRKNPGKILDTLANSNKFFKVPFIVTAEDIGTDIQQEILSTGASDIIIRPYPPLITKKRITNIVDVFNSSVATMEDGLTGLFSRRAFFKIAEGMIAAEKPGFYTMVCFDIDNFKVINDQYGTHTGDTILKNIAAILKRYVIPSRGIVCRIMADNFAALYPSTFSSTEAINRIHRLLSVPVDYILPISFSIGRYVIDDLSLSPSAMYDRAALAMASIKKQYGIKVAYYDESMRKKVLDEQEITSEMDIALKNHNFEVWFQPQYNHSTGALIGAEALARWRHPKKGLISPIEFIPVFERNGFIYSLDKYIWEQTCILLRKWLDEGRSPLPVSVNISRYDIFCDDVIDTVKNIINRYNIPVDLLRLEITESAFSKSTEHIIKVVSEFIALGFTVEIDDFGSGYSSLNTLKDVMAQVVKLDMRFLENSDNTERGGNILESIIRMTKWLGVSVIAEGVETAEQADFLKSIGCNYVQGYFYAMPMPYSEYETIARKIVKEEKMLTLETVMTLNNDSFWNPKSIETLIFNTYVGSACVFEYVENTGAIELLRANDKYVKMINDSGLNMEYAFKTALRSHLYDESRTKMHNAFKTAITTKEEVSGEYKYINLPGKSKTMYIRSTLRRIASAGKRHLIYCTNEDITAQFEAEQQKNEALERLRLIMENINIAVTVVTIDDEKTMSFIFANDKYYEMLGCSKEQFEHEQLLFFDFIHPDDRQSIIEHALKATTRHERFSCTYRIIRYDGRIIWAQSYVSVSSLSGIDKPVQICVTNDITLHIQPELVDAEKEDNSDPCL